MIPVELVLHTTTAPAEKVDVLLRSVPRKDELIYIDGDRYVVMAVHHVASLRSTDVPPAPVVHANLLH